MSDLMADETGIDRYIVTRSRAADPLISGKPVVLLTGAWPYGPSNPVVELDSAIDRRFVHLDREAERLAERAGAGATDGSPERSDAWINALALRYYLLRLLRVIEFFYEVDPPHRGECIRLIANRADRDDVTIISDICRRVGAECGVRWQGRETEEVEPKAQQSEWWRTTLRRLAKQLPSTGRKATAETRIVLCGNPRFLDPLCDVLLERKCRVWWLYDRFAVKSFLRWHRRGIDQLTCCEDSRAQDEPADERIELPSLEYRGIDLQPLVTDWLNKRLATRRHEQRRWQRQIERHFQQIGPDLLVMDEDATPMKRIALAAARRHGGTSYVVQHGAPVARFGFAPLAADGIFAWGLSTREQLERWDVPRDRIFVTGSPAHDLLYATIHNKSPREHRTGKSPRILLLATVPPRDDRPDLIEMNLNTRSYGEMIEAAFAAVETIPNATLIVKPHPRAEEDPAVLAAVARHRNVQVRTTRTRALADALRGVDCVLSCLSSAGIEAALAGIPVIQLVPRGAGSVLPSGRWGVLGSASDAAELLVLIDAALQDRQQTVTASGNVFANVAFWERGSAEAPDAATRIADVLLDRAKQSVLKSRIQTGQGRSKAYAEK